MIDNGWMSTVLIIAGANGGRDQAPAINVSVAYVAWVLLFACPEDDIAV